MTRPPLASELVTHLETRRAAALQELRAKADAAPAVGEPSALDRWLDWIANRREDDLASLVAAGVLTVHEARTAILANVDLFGEKDLLSMMRRGWLQPDEVREALRAIVTQGGRR